MKHKEIQLDFKDVNQDILLFCAFRYALGRQTYVVGSICQIMKFNWDRIHETRRAMFKKEIREAIDKGRAGSKYDVEEWEKILMLED